MIIACLSALMGVNTNVQQAKVSVLPIVSKAFELSHMLSSPVFAYFGRFQCDERPSSATLVQPRILMTHFCCTTRIGPLRHTRDGLVVHAGDT